MNFDKERQKGFEYKDSQLSRGSIQVKDLEDTKIVLQSMFGFNILHLSFKPIKKENKVIIRYKGNDVALWDGFQKRLFYNKLSILRLFLGDSNNAS